MTDSETGVEIRTDQGTAYGLTPGSHDPDLTEVGAGSPMGELMRRYWHQRSHWQTISRLSPGLAAMPNSPLTGYGLNYWDK